MFTTVRQYRCDPADAQEIVRLTDEFADSISMVDGFDGYEVVDCGDGMLFTITVCDTREACERSVEMAAEFVRENMGDLQIERIGAWTGELRVNRARAGLMDLVHA